MEHQSTEETKVTEDFEESSDAVKSVILENHEENEITVHGDQRVWVKPSDELFTDQIKEEISECEYQTFVDVKDEIVEEEEEEEEEKEIKIQPTIVCEPIQLPLPPPPPPPPAIDIQVKKVSLPKLNSKTVKKPRGRMGRRPRPILPMTQPIASTSTSLLEQASTQHQIIMPSTQMPGIAYQIFLGDNGKNSNNSVQYTMLQPRPVFLQQASTPVSTPSSMMISQPYPVTRSQVSTAKIPKIAPKMMNQSYCSFCYKLFKNIKEHVKECWANPASKNYKFRKIAPSTPL
ncbi:max-binding protein MNT-like [Aphis gossypii]|uniref:max-binding protein MNT-like n=1 Tax=Aphis gossypii TaxID=80765 RepID=UPI002158B9AA|nr:max-binding protein MNT-like [Aphis gossypii]